MYRAGPLYSPESDYSRCAVMPSGFNLSRGARCLEPLDDNHTFIPELSGFRKLGDEVKMRWVWCLFFILVIPELMTVLKCFWNLRFELDAKKGNIIFIIEL